MEEEYALVFCQTHMTTAHRPPFTWLRKAYGMFQVDHASPALALALAFPLPPPRCCPTLSAEWSPTHPPNPPPLNWGSPPVQRKYKKNLKAAYIIHASTLVRMTLKLFKPFISSKFWKKLVYIDQVTDIYQVYMY